MKRIAIAGTLVAVLALASTALGAFKLAGTYQTTIKTTQLGGQLDGVWTIKFTAKGHHYTVTDAGKVVIHGLYAVKAKVVTFRDKSGPDACPGAGKYKAAPSGSKLTFTKLTDTAQCIGRQVVLAGTFTKL